MKKYLMIPFGSLMLLYGTAVFAHGESKPGPHKGNIQMPGAFHTEILIRKGKVIVYLLDIAMKNPTTKNSSIKVALDTPATTEKLICKADADKFVCDLPKGQAIKDGKLLVDAIRGSAKGSTATYGLPLKFK